VTRYLIDTCTFQKIKKQLKKLKKKSKKQKMTRDSHYS